MTLATTPPNTPAGSADGTPIPQRGNAFRRLLKNRLALISVIVISIVVLAAILAPVLPITDPAKVNLADRLLGPGSDGHLLGTDKLGRDLLSRLIWGSRVSLLVGLIATVCAAVIGSLIGLISGFFRGITDSILMRGIDVVMAYPYLLLAIALVAALGPGLTKAMIAVAVVNIPFFARAVRGATLSVTSQEYVEAAGMAGRGRFKVLFLEVLPNVSATVLVTSSTTIGWMITETAGLSFLGLGAQPPASDWGTMLGDGRDLLTVAPHVSIIPGLAIFIVVMALNFIGDGLRDVLDPRLQ